MSPQIDIVSYRPTWPDDFSALKAALLPVSPAGSRLHHIGSTAVPGLAAKNVIDLQLTVEALDQVDEDAFARSGFVRAPLIVVDHCPPGLELGPEDLAKRFFRSVGRAANLHVRQAGRFNQRYALLCRDYLRSHPVAAGAYQLIKQRLAARFPDDMDAYYDIKDPVFDIIVDGADEWARRIAWSESPGD